MNLKDIFNRKKTTSVAEQTPVTVVDSSANPIGDKQINEAYHILNHYKGGKAHLEAKIIENEKWFKVRHWETLPDRPKQIEPASGWLFNAIANKHASAMDNIPTVSILPREEQDKGEAEALSAVIPVILDGCNFEETYDEATYYKERTGACCYAVLWNNEMHNGLGDVDIKGVDLLNLFWEPGITDIQKSRNLFHVELCDNDLLEEQYPQLKGKLGGKAFSVAEYMHDENINTEDKSAVIDWYYKKRRGTKNILHFCKFVNNTVLFSTENDPQYAEEGWYADGRYPFVIDKLFPIPGSPAGFGFVDIGKNTQTYIDRLGQAILENALANATPRHFISSASNVNEDEFLDRNNPLIHYAGNGDGIVPVQTNTLSGIYYQVYEGKINELKETTGNRDVNTGGSASGVTAASAIAAMQEAGSRLDRDDIRASYRAFKEVVLMVIERIRQFYDLPRYFRILGPNGAQDFIQYSNENIRMQATRFEGEEAISYRMPYFDVEVVATKQSPYSRMSQNELALQFYNLGFFDPSRADMALSCLEMMDFDRKSFVTEKIAQNGTMFQMMMAMQQQMIGMQSELDRINGTAIAPQMVASMGGGAPAPRGGGKVDIPVEGEESSVTANARKRVAESTSPV